jgi:GNAT superfamily N-acetyltransferase
MASSDVHVRLAESADVPAMAACRLRDPAAGPADPRMDAYFNGQHHPHQALLPRVGYVAVVDEQIVGYIAGHRTTRHGYSGEIQYLFVAPEYRRRSVGSRLVQRLAQWFDLAGARNVCVCVDADSPAAVPFYNSLGAAPFKRFWMGWADISASLARRYIRGKRPVRSG